MRALEKAMGGGGSTKKRTSLKDRLRAWEAPKNSGRRERVASMIEALRMTIRAAEARRAVVANRSALLRLNPMTVKNSQKEAFSKLMTEKNAEAKRLGKSMRNVVDSERAALAREDAVLVSLGRTSEAIIGVAEAFGTNVALPSDFPEDIAAVRNASKNVERGVLNPGEVAGLRDYADYLAFQAEEVLSKRTRIYGGVTNSVNARELRNAVDRLEREKKELEAKLKTRGDWLRLHRRERRKLVARVATERGKTVVRSNANDLARAMGEMRIDSSKKRTRNSGPVSMNWSATKKARS